MALYLGDANGTKPAANVFKGWLGDRNAYAGFTYGGPEKICLGKPIQRTQSVSIRLWRTIQGHNVDGMLPDDIRWFVYLAAMGSKAQMYSWEGFAKVRLWRRNS